MRRGAPSMASSPNRASGRISVTVILRQPHRPLGPQGGEAAVRPAEAVDGLVGIADGEKGAALPPPGPEKPELEAVDVLELVCQQVGKAPVRPAALPLAQGLQQEVVKVQLSLQLLLIEGKGRVVPAVRSGLVPGDRPEEGPGAPLPAQLRQSGGRRHPLLIGAGQGHGPQQLQADGVEGADGHGAGRPLAQTPLQPRPQLPCRPVGEGHGGELRGLGPPLLHQPGHPLLQGAGALPVPSPASTATVASSAEAAVRWAPFSPRWGPPPPPRSVRASPPCHGPSWPPWEPPRQRGSPAP